MTQQEIQELFHTKHYRATPQRISIYKYLCEHPTHPDCECIYKMVKKEQPNLSLTTIYNVLESLEREGLITKVNIDSERVHYDADTSLHGHFRCKECGKIYDFDIKSMDIGGIDDFDISQKEVYYSGICNACNKYSE